MRFELKLAQLFNFPQILLLLDSQRIFEGFELIKIEKSVKQIQVSVFHI